MAQYFELIFASLIKRPADRYLKIPFRQRICIISPRGKGADDRIFKIFLVQQVVHAGAELQPVVGLPARHEVEQAVGELLAHVVEKQVGVDRQGTAWPLQSGDVAAVAAETEEIALRALELAAGVRAQDFQRDEGIRRTGFVPAPVEGPALDPSDDLTELLGCTGCGHGVVAGVAAVGCSTA